MLEQKDIEMIKIAVGEVVIGRFDAMEHRMDNMEHRMDNMEHCMDNMEQRMDNMGHRMDNMEHCMDNMEQRMDEKFDAMDKKFSVIAKKHEYRMDLILDEVVRVHEGLQGQIDRLEKNVSDIKQFYRIDKLENDSVSMLIEKVADLDKRVTRLENQPA